MIRLAGQLARVRTHVLLVLALFWVVSEASDNTHTPSPTVLFDDELSQTAPSYDDTHTPNPTVPFNKELSQTSTRHDYGETLDRELEEHAYSYDYSYNYDYSYDYSEAPTLAPTATPTTTDTVSIEVSMAMDGLDASAITDEDIAALKVAIAAVMDGGITSTMIKNVEVTDASTRRKLLNTAATVSFDVVAPLSETDFADADALLAEVDETMSDISTDATELIDAIKEELQSSGDDDGSKWDTVTVTQTSAVIVTRSPTAAPTSKDGGSRGGGGGGGGDNTHVAYAVAGSLCGALALLAGAGVAGFYNKHKKLPGRNDLPASFAGGAASRPARMSEAYATKTTSTPEVRSLLRKPPEVIEMGVVQNPLE